MLFQSKRWDKDQRIDFSGVTVFLLWSYLFFYCPSTETQQGNTFWNTKRKFCTKTQFFCNQFSDLNDRPLKPHNKLKRTICKDWPAVQSMKQIGDKASLEKLLTVATAAETGALDQDGPGWAGQHPPELLLFHILLTHLVDFFSSPTKITILRLQDNIWSLFSLFYRNIVQIWFRITSFRNASESDLLAAGMNRLSRAVPEGDAKTYCCVNRGNRPSTMQSYQQCKCVLVYWAVEVNKCPTHLLS